MSRNPPRLIIHLGQHKTGSKALQSFLARHVPRLAREGVLYPLARPRPRIHAYAVSHHRLYVLLRHEALLATGDAPTAARYLAEHGRHCAPFTTASAFFDWLEHERRRAAAHTVILSAEDLLDLATAHETGYQPATAAAAAQHLATLARSAGFAVRLVVYLRRQDHLLAAHYVQFIKGGGRADLDFAAFANAFAPRLRSSDLLRPWAETFGAENILVRPYERTAQPAGIVADFFEHVLGRLPPPAWTPPAADRESVNASPDRDHLEFIRRLRLGLVPGAAGLGVEDVLDALPAAATASVGPAAWLSPRERLALLAEHADGNARIATVHLGSTDGTLFREPLPDASAPWAPHAGLSPEREHAILNRARAVGRRPARLVHSLLRSCLGRLRRLRSAVRRRPPR